MANESPTTPRRKSHRLVWLAAICALCGGGYLLSQTYPNQTTSNSKKKGGKKGRGGGADQAVPVSVAKVTQGNIGEYINALGTVTPVYTVTVTSRVAGELIDVQYKEGQVVKKGDLLAVIDPRPYQALVTQGQGQLLRDQALLRNALIDLDRYKSAYQQHAIPEQQLATQQALVDQDQGTVKLDQGNLDAAQVNLDYTRITSPIDGRVGLRLVDPGNIVAANGTAGLLVITQLQPITVVFTMAEDYLDEVVGQTRAGRKLSVAAFDRDQQKQIAQGQLLTIDNQIDQTTGTVRVKSTFANKDYRLFPNEFVNAKMLVRTLNKVNLMPSAAVQRNNDVSFVYVVGPDNAAHSRNVTVATTEGNTSAVSGVSPGDTVVTDGFDKLEDGMKVTAEAPIAPTSQVASPQTTPARQQTPTQGSSTQQVPARTK